MCVCVCVRMSVRVSPQQNQAKIQNITLILNYN